MPELSDTQQKTVAAAAKNLKKIIAGRGGIEGRFYFAGSKDAAFGVVAISLAAKDPSGKRVAGEGKKLRQEIKGARFASGTVHSRNNKLVFEVGAGTASAGLLKKAFRGALCQIDGLGYLKRAVVTTPTEQDADDGEEVDLDADEIWSQMSAAERAEMWELRAQQARLGDLNDQARAFFQEDALAEIAQEVQVHLSGIQEIVAHTPVDLDGLAEERAALAALAATGPDPFPGVGQSVSPEIREVFNATIYASIVDIRDRLRRDRDTLDEMREAARRAAPEEQASRSRSLEEALRPRQEAAGRFLDQLNTLLS